MVSRALNTTVKFKCHYRRVDKLVRVYYCTLTEKIIID